MQIRRRTFLRATLGAVPALAAIWSPASAAPRAANATTVPGVGPTASRFAIDGWDKPANFADDQVLIRLNASWSAAWH
jgi:hypothetical protein